MFKIYKFSIFLIIYTTLISSVIFIGFGVYRFVHALIMLVQIGIDSKPGLEIIESLDAFLIALVFLMVGLGFIKLFYPKLTVFKEFDLPWLKVNDFYDLKHLLWNTILLTLLVTFGIQIIKAKGVLDVNLLIIPAAVLMFALSAKFMKH